MVLLSVVVPTFNEASHVQDLLAEIEHNLAGRDYEIVVVDDNSPDGTHARVQEYGRKHARIRGILRTNQKGLATAVIEGMRQSRGTYVVVMDSDFQHPPSTVPQLLDAALEGDADCVVASRYAPGGSQTGFPAARRVISWGARTLAVLGLPVVRRNKVRDPMSGFFLVRRDRVPLDELRPRGYKILVEILARSRLERVTEVGYAFQNRRGGQSKLRIKTQIDYMLHVVSLAWNDRENRRLFSFLLVGASGLFIHLAALALLIDVAGWDNLWVTERGGEEFLLGTLAAGMVAREVAILWNFGWNDRVTFHFERRQAHHRFTMRLIRFHIVSLWAFLAYVAIFYPLIHIHVHYLLAAPVAILAGVVLNYAGNLRWTYARRRETHGQ